MIRTCVFMKCQKTNLYFIVAQIQTIEMVFLTKVLNFAKERKVLRQHMRHAFVDSLRILVRGGDGGSGFPKLVIYKKYILKN